MKPFIHFLLFDRKTSASALVCLAPSSSSFIEKTSDHQKAAVNVSDTHPLLTNTERVYFMNYPTDVSALAAGVLVKARSLFNQGVFERGTDSVPFQLSKYFWADQYFQKVALQKIQDESGALKERILNSHLFVLEAQEGNLEKMKEALCASSASLHYEPCYHLTMSKGLEQAQGSCINHSLLWDQTQKNLFNLLVSPFLSFQEAALLRQELEEKIKPSSIKSQSASL